jgi:hypothetical protein
MVKRSPAAIRLLLVVCAWALAMPAFAQTSPPAATAVSVVESDDASYMPEPAHIAVIDGVAEVARDGRAEPASINVPLVSGDQLRTREGLVEVVFGDGSVLDVDHFTTIDFLSDALIRMTDGRIRLTIGGRDRVAYRVDTPSGAVRIDTPGEYRIALIGESGRHDVELVTVRGFATLVNELGETSVRAGERAFATAAMAPSYAQAYNSATWDAFDQWSAARRDERTGTTSTRYLPEEVRGYAGDFDRYGAWQYDVSYGYVWYPRVAVGWRPYYYGQWSYYGPWGWTWISYHPWGWPTHHYGRWGFNSGAWFWIPSRHWAPAHVYWAGASNYVGWCPLGWNNRPIFAINIGFGYGHGGYHGYDPYRAWTVVPRHAFRNHVDVGRYAVARTEIDHAVPRWYVSGASAPIRPAVVSRNVSPIYSAGRTARAMTNGTGVRGREVYGSPANGPSAFGAPGRAMPRTGIGRANDTVPRATPPASAGALGPSSRWQSRNPGETTEVGETRSRVAPGARGTERQEPGASRARPRAPYRDAGPGGPEPRYTPNTIDDRAPYAPAYGRGRAVSPGTEAGPNGSDGRNPQAGAPSGVPSGGIYGQRGVPRDDSGRGYPPRYVPRNGEVYAPPQRTDPPRTYYPAPSRGRTEGGAGGYAPRSAPDRPSYGPPPSAPAPSRGEPAARPTGGGGGDRGGERAAPRGGGSTGPSRPGGGHARPRPQ